MGHPIGRHPIRTFLLIISLVVLTACAPGSTPETVPLAYVAVGGGNHLRILDLSEGPGGGDTLRRLYTGAGPWRLEPSPDGRQLWIQHWYAGLTTVLDLEDHQVAATLPLRGPGAFSADGDAFHSFHWPDEKLHTVGAQTFEALAEPRSTEVRQVYDLLPAASGQALYLAQHDPMARGPSPRYGYVVVYPHQREPEKANPASLPTGVAPVGLVAVPGQPFLFSIDSGTNGLSLLNEQHDGRSVAVCPAPRGLAFHQGEDGAVERMAVICWRGDGHPTSRVVLFRTDFTARPWPTVERLAEATVAGGLSAVRFAAHGDRPWVTDRTHGRLLELAMAAEPDGAEGPAKLEIRRDIATGPVPLDLVIRSVTPQERQRIADGRTRGRQLAEETLARLIAAGEPFAGLSWRETVVPREEADGEADPAADGETAEPETATEPSLRWLLRPPDALRVEHPQGFRLARDGHSLLVDGWGRFWVAPRQELLAVVYALPALSLDEAVRRLAGDVAGSPWLSGGLALDLAAEVTDADGARSILLGADRPGLRVAQLWVEADGGRPTGLLEQLPDFTAPGVDFHGGGGAPEMVETQFLGFTRVDDRLWMPSQIERWVEGRQGPLVRLEDFQWLAAENAGDEAGDVRFDPTRLGGASPAPELFAPAAPADGGDDAGPGRPVAVVAAGGEHAGSALPGSSPPAVAYPSQPPAAGPYLPYAADWGAHDVPVPLPLQVHNLLDGGVALQWHCPRGCPQLVAAATAYARERERILVAPYPWLGPSRGPSAGGGEDGEPRLALTAWGRVQILDGFDRSAVDAFVDSWGGVDHHGEADAH